MSDPSLELQGAVRQALAAPLAPLVGARIYDRVPQGTPPPYAFLSGFEITADPADCVDGVEVFFNVQIVSRGPGRVEAARIASAVLNALDGLEPALPGFEGVQIQHRTTRYLPQDDGETTRAVVTFSTLADRA